MIIGIDATQANKKHKTGVEWYAYHLIRAISRSNSEHTYRLYFRTEPEKPLQNLGPHIQYRMLKWPFKYLWTQLRLSLEMILNPPDVLFIPGQIIPLIHPYKTVTTIHDVAFRPYPTSYTFKQRLYLNLAAILASRLPAIMTISKFSKSEIIKYYNPPADRIHIAHLGFKHLYPEPSPMILTKHNIKKPYIVTIGRLERKKNTAFLIKVFNEVKQQDWGKRLQLVLVGTKGYGWNEIDRVIKKSKFRDDIRVIGWVSESEKHSLLTQAELFMLVSAYEGFGLPLLEAMNAGTPIITSDQASLPEIAGDAAVIVPRGDIKAHILGIREVMINADTRAKLVNSGKERVKKFSWDHTAEKTMDVLEKLLS